MKPKPLIKRIWDYQELAILELKRRQLIGWTAKTVSVDKVDNAQECWEETHNTDSIVFVFVCSCLRACVCMCEDALSHFCNKGDFFLSLPI